MNIKYQFEGNEYLLSVDWGGNLGLSVFKNIRKEIEKRHGINLVELQSQIECMDEIINTLYGHIYSMPQHLRNTYNPALPRILQKSMSELITQLDMLFAYEKNGFFYLLCKEVLAYWDQMLEVFLEDNRYQCKILEREKNSEKHNQKIIHSLPQENITSEFEEYVLQMTDISNVLKSLTEKQRRRLVLHIFAGYSISIISEMESTSKQSVHESIKGALAKLKEELQ